MIKTEKSKLGSQVSEIKKSFKTRKKLQAILAVTLWLVIISFILSLRPVQSFFAHIVADKLSEKYHTEIRIDYIHFNIFTGNIMARGIFMADAQKDTLASVEEVSVHLTRFSISDMRFEIGRLKLYNTTVKLYADSKGKFNYEFLENYLDTTKSDSAPDTTHQDFNISIRHLYLNNINFVYSRKKSDPGSHEMDFENIRINNFCLDADNFSINDKINIVAEIKSMSVNEHCGFKLNNLSAETVVSPKGIRFENLNLKTPCSDLKFNKLFLLTDDFSSYSDFCNSVIIDADIQTGSIFSTDDLAFFAGDCYGYNINTSISGIVQGPVCDMNIKNLNVNYLNDTKINLNAVIKGLPEIQNTYFVFDINQLSCSVDDLSDIHMPEDTSQPLFNLPDMLKSIGQINYKAKLIGTINNLEVKGDLISEIGNISTRVTVKSENDYTSVEGFVNAQKLDLGAVTMNSKQLGTLSLNNSVNVSIFKDGTIKGFLKGTVDSAVILGHRYNQIAINGEFNQNMFNGSILIRDSCMNVTFNGIADFSDSSPKFNFNLDIPIADLAAVNIVNDSVANFKMGMEADFQGSDFANLNGHLNLTRKLVFNHNNKSLHLNNLDLKAYIVNYVCGLENRKIELRSDFIDADLKGMFSISQLSDILSNFVYMIMPSLNYEGYNLLPPPVPKNKRKKIDFSDPDFRKMLGNIFEYTARVKDMDRLTDFFMPQLKISNSTTLEGGFDTRLRKIFTTIKTDRIVYDDITIDSLYLSLNSKDKELNFCLRMDSITTGTGIKVNKPTFNLTASKDTVKFVTTWNNSDSIKNQGRIDGGIILTPSKTRGKFPVTTLLLNQDTIWAHNICWIVSPSKTVMDSTTIEIQNMKFASTDQYIIADGFVCNIPDKKLTLDIQKFNLDFINKFLPDLKLTGILSGKTEIYNALGKLPHFESRNEIENFKAKGVEPGNLVADLKYTYGDTVLTADFYTTKYLTVNNNPTSGNKIIHGHGFCDMKNKNVDFKLDINNIPLNTFKAYYENYIDLSKYAVLEGYANINGSWEKPQVSASLNLKGCTFKIYYLGTKYNINESMLINVDNNKIQLSKTKILSDKASGVAYIEGQIVHDNFTKAEAQFSFEAKNFMFMNIPASDTASFYGTAYASGTFKINGDPTQMLNIDARVKTEKNTHVYLPLYNTIEVSEDYDFLTFVNTPDYLKKIDKRKAADLTGLRMNFNLEVTPAAEVQIIMDETTGNYIKASANGNLRLDINQTGDFQMYGTLALEKGEYLFNMSNILSKKFEVKKGSTLRWNGNPMEADVNIAAYYKIRKANLYNLMLSEDYRDKKVPVSCYLNMKNELLNPDISFSLDVEDNDERVQTQISNLDEGNINKQVISLLLLNQFQPLPGLKSGNSSSMFSDINPGELVSNQINHWLSDLTDKVDVGVNYSMGDNTTTDQFELSLSTQLFNERVSISSNLGVGGENKTAAATQNTNSVIGEVEVDVNLNKSGSVKLKAYNKANEENFTDSPYKQGVGISFKKDFNKISQLFTFRRKKKNLTFPKY